MVWKLKFFCQTLFKNFVVKTQNADVPDFCFTLLDAAGLSQTLVLNQNAQPKREEVGSVSKNVRQKLQRFYTQVGAALAVCTF